LRTGRHDSNLIANPKYRLFADFARRDFQIEKAVFVRRKSTRCQPGPAITCWTLTSGIARLSMIAAPS